MKDQARPEPGRGADWTAAPASVWDQAEARPVARLEAPRLELRRGIDQQ